MQQATVDVSALRDVAVGDPVEIRARRLTVSSHIDRVYR
jgi:alanine racemase